MKKKTVQYGLMACLISDAMLIDAAQAQPKISAANRETVRIMKQIKIPAPYTPAYQPMTWQQYVPPATPAPDYSPKIMSVQTSSIPKSISVAPSALPVTTTNATSASATNIPAIDKTVKTPAPVVTVGKEKAQEILKPVDKAQPDEKK